MSWVRTFSTDEMLCYEQRTNTVSTRIESRKNDDGWIIYKTHYDKSGLNHTEEFVAPTFDKMNQVIKTLQKQKRPTATQLQELLLERSKRTKVSVERAYKEYNVEKWNFAVNGESFVNMAFARCFDEIDLDVLLHQKYKDLEEEIINELMNVLGFDGLDDATRIKCIYFSQIKEKQVQKEDPLEFL